MNRLSLPALVLTATGAFVFGWHVRDTAADRDMARHQAVHAQALADAVRNARALESQFVRDLETLHHDTQHQLAALAATERRAADQRVRDIAAQYAARHRPVADDSAAASECAATAVAADVLAELLGELDALAQGYAAEADRRGIAGHACETGYERIRADQNSEK